MDQLDLQQLSQMVPRVRSTTPLGAGPLPVQLDLGWFQGLSQQQVWTSTLPSGSVSLQIAVFYRASPRHKLKIVKVCVCV